MNQNSSVLESQTPIVKQILFNLIEQKAYEIDEWFDKQYSQAGPFFYSSVDLRHSGWKMAPVDTNLFPAGFNLLSENARNNAIEQIKNYIKAYSPDAKKMLIIPENHTRNTYYLENIFTLKSILEKAGLQVFVGGLEAEETLTLETALGNELQIFPITRSDDKLSLRDCKFTPEIVLVNNDFSSGAPEIMQNLNQLVSPPVGMGWYKRRKTRHFNTYDEVAHKFSAHFNIDKWLISTIFERCGEIDFKEKSGLECVALNVERTLERIKNQYETYGIKEQPYVFIKADNGTYGMGIMTVKSGDEMMEINKKIRNKMNAIKEGVKNTEVIIQEGVPTIDEIEGKTAEPLVYLINGKPIGCTYRVNESRGAYENLNASGMTFSNQDSSEHPSDEKSLCPVQGLVARLATLAATRECYDQNWQI